MHIKSHRDFIVFRLLCNRNF